MDTSETYIKMCDCKEIQELWEPYLGDYYVRNAGVDILSFKGILILRENKKALGNLVWLPRQDQLQEMVKQPYLLVEFFDWWKGLVMIPPLRSMEQLWLAFVRKEKYSKTWNGEEWNKCQTVI